MEDVLEHVQTLQLHESAHRVRDRAIAGCWKWIAEAIADGDLPGITAEDIQLRFHRCALIFSSGLVSYPFLETAFEVVSRKHPNPHALDGLVEIAHYRLITGIDGSDVDDYFEIEQPRGGPATE